ncbi:MAG TPA: hypothetical protein VN026_08565 [Bacteroidia bacterium]|nr:hypothetical protein [Bacteroidia bacterium]
MGELEYHTQPYIKFWCAWIKSDDCFLNEKEIALANSFILNKFSIENLKSVSSETVNEVEQLLCKLKNGFTKFQFWLAFGFATTIIRMADEYGSDKFLNTPIKELKISNEIKNILIEFKVETIIELFENYNEEDFTKIWVYQKILEFEVVLNREGKSLFKKISNLPKEEYSSFCVNDG